MSYVINASICISDLPDTAYNVGKNGKKYLNFGVFTRKDVGEYGHTHFIQLNQSKEQREAKAPKSFIGDGKIFNFDNNVAAKPAEDDDLPF